MEKRHRYVRITELHEIYPEFPIAQKTLYQWRHIGRFPEIFRKIGNTLCVDLVSFEAMVEKNHAAEMKKKKR